VAAGIVALQALPGVGETKASAILAAATAWVAEHPAMSGIDDGSESPEADQGGSEIQPNHLER
jgi:hypothetical protein